MNAVEQYPELITGVLHGRPDVFLDAKPLLFVPTVSTKQEVYKHVFSDLSDLKRSMLDELRRSETSLADASYWGTLTEAEVIALVNAECRRAGDIKRNYRAFFRALTNAKDVPDALTVAAIMDAHNALCIWLFVFGARLVAQFLVAVYGKDSVEKACGIQASEQTPNLPDAVVQKTKKVWQDATASIRWHADLLKATDSTSPTLKRLTEAGVFEENPSLEELEAQEAQKMERLLDVKEAAAVLGISPFTLHAHIRKRVGTEQAVPVHLVNMGRGKGKYVIEAGALREWARKFRCSERSSGL